MSYTKILKVYSQVEAEVVKSYLQSQNIHVLLQGTDQSGMYPSLSSFDGIDILVDSDQAQKATSLLKEFRQEN